MIKALIFDFGDVFINLDKQGAIDHALDLFGIDHFEEDMIHINMMYEKGLITSDDFIAFYTNKFPKLSESHFTNTWNFIIKDFPLYRLDFLKNLSGQNNFDLLLLSNTNALHIDYVKETVPFYEDFRAQFNQFYLSHEIHYRKPDPEIFEFLLVKNNLSAQDCLFIDDTEENILTAKEIGFHTWHLDPIQEDVVSLFETCKHVFDYE